MSTQSKNDYFLPAEYFTFTSEDGSVQTKDFQSVLIAPDNLLGSLASKVIEAVPDADSLFYNAGKMWGGKFFNQFDKILVGLYPEISHSSELDMEIFLDHLSSLIATLGWGTFSLEPDNDLLFIKTPNPPYVELSENSGWFYCRLFAGFLSGLFSVLAGNNLECVDIDLSAPSAFLYLLTDEETAATVKSLKQQGLGRAELLAKLGAGA
jgi:uncharacterized protein